MRSPIVGLTVLLLSLVTVAPEATTFERLEFADVVRSADVIFVGELLDLRVWEQPAGPMIFTDYRFAVTRRIHEGPRSAVENEHEIVLTFPGGTIGGRGVSLGEPARLEVGGRYLIFALADGGRYVSPIVGGPQGLFRVTADARTGESFALNAAGAAIRGVRAGRLELTAIVEGIADGIAMPRAERLPVAGPPVADSPGDGARNAEPPNPEPALPLEAFIREVERLLGATASGPPETPGGGPGAPTANRADGVPAEPPGAPSGPAGYPRPPDGEPALPWSGAGDVRAPLCFAGHVTAPLTIEQLPSAAWPWSHNNDAMWQWNQYVDLYRSFPSDGTWGNNGVFEFGGFPTSAELNAIYGVNWGNAIGLTYMQWDTPSLLIRQADVFFNPANAWWPELADTLGDTTRTLYRPTLMHELGHTWGAQAVNCIEDYRYTQLSVMHAIYNDIVEDGWGIHAWDSLAYRLNYSGQVTPAPRRDVGVESYYAADSGLLQNATSNRTDVDPGTPIVLSNIVVENMSSAAAPGVRLRVFLSADTTITPADLPLGTFWDLGTLGLAAWWRGDVSTVIPESTPPGTYRIGLIATMDGAAYSEDDLPFNNRTYLAETIAVRPANDLCTTATAIGLGATAFSTRASDSDGRPAPGCSPLNDVANDVWFRFVSPCSGTLTATTCGLLGGSADFDSVVAVYAGCDCPTIALAACNDNDPLRVCGQAGISQSTVNLPVQSGACYTLRVGSTAYGLQGTGVLRLSLDGELPNQYCAGAAPIGDGTTTFDARCAVGDGPAGACGPVAEDVWYDYTAGCSGVATFSTCEQFGGSATFDTRLEAFDGTAACPPPAAASLGCNDNAPMACGNAPQGHSTLPVPVERGQHYKIKVGGQAPGIFGTGDLAVACHELSAAPAQVWDPQSVFQSAFGWFPATSHQRVFPADVTGDGLDDLVGLANDGALWVAPSTGAGFAPAEVWRPGTVFSLANGWFSLAYHDRFWLADVTGDGRADVLAIANNGQLWVAESSGTDFGAAHLAAESAFTADQHLLPTLRRRIWVADVTGDGAADVVGIDAGGSLRVSVATGSGTTATFAPSALWLTPFNGATGNVFTPQAGWFSPSSTDRVWLGDVTGDGRADLVGIDFAGNVWASESTDAGMQTTHLALAGTVMRTDAPSLDGNWFYATGSRARVWLADVTGDGRDDIVGVAPVADGDGDVWAAIATGDGAAASFTERVLLRDSVFKSAFGWFAAAQRPRVFVGDVTGDGAADLVGVDFSGMVWLARSARQAASASAGAPGDATRYSMEPALPTGAQAMRNGTGFFDGERPRIWLVDVTGDGVRDLLGIAPGIGGLTDGSVLWRPVLPAGVIGVSPIDRADIEDGDGVDLTVAFSRAIDPGTLGDNTLQVEQDGASLQPTLLSVEPRQATWHLPFAPTAGGPLTVAVALPQDAVADRWSRPVDVDGDPTRRADLVRRGQWSERLLAAATRITLDSPPLGVGAVQFPGDFLKCSLPSTPAATANPPQARVLVLAGGGACRSDADCHPAQSCNAFQCRAADGPEADATLVLVSVDAAGLNAARIQSLAAVRFGLPPERIVVAATHGQSTLRTIEPWISPYHDDRDSPNRFEPYVSWVEAQILDAIADALGRLEPVDIASDSGKVAGLTVNRRSHDDIDGVSTDHDLRVLRFTRVSDGGALATVVHFAVQPVIMAGTGAGQGGARIDAGLPGYLTAELEAPCVAEGCVVLFLNGAAGDVHPAAGVGSFDESVARAAAAQLAAAVNGLATTPTSTAGFQLDVQRSVSTIAGGVSSCAACPTDPPRSHMRPAAWELESTLASLGRPGEPPLITLAAFPGEFFVRLGLRLAAESPLGNTALVGYANGFLGSFPDAAAIADGLDRFGVDACNGPTFFYPASTPGEDLIDATLQSIAERLVHCTLAPESLRLDRDPASGDILLTWGGAAGAWDVARGALDTLRSGGVTSDATCVADDLALTEAAAPPGAGPGTWYLARCDDRDWGLGKAGARRTLDPSVCP